jgi:hypothetical protein
MSQCPSCGSDCGYTKKSGCQQRPDTRLIEAKKLLTSKEFDDIQRIVAKWDYATEAAIECYLLGIHRGSKVRDL